MKVIGFIFLFLASTCSNSVAATDEEGSSGWELSPFVGYLRGDIITSLHEETISGEEEMKGSIAFGLRVSNYVKSNLAVEVGVLRGNPDVEAIGDVLVFHERGFRFGDAELTLLEATALYHWRRNFFAGGGLGYHQLDFGTEDSSGLEVHACVGAKRFTGEHSGFRGDIRYHFYQTDFANPLESENVGQISATVGFMIRWGASN